MTKIILSAKGNKMRTGMRVLIAFSCLLVQSKLTFSQVTSDTLLLDFTQGNFDKFKITLEKTTKSGDTRRVISCTLDQQYVCIEETTVNSRREVLELKMLKKGLFDRKKTLAGLVHFIETDIFGSDVVQPLDTIGFRIVIKYRGQAHSRTFSCQDSMPPPYMTALYRADLVLDEIAGNEFKRTRFLDNPIKLEFPSKR